MKSLLLVIIALCSFTAFSQTSIELSATKAFAVGQREEVRNCFDKANNFGSNFEVHDSWAYEISNKTISEDPYAQVVANQYTFSGTIYLGDRMIGEAAIIVDETVDVDYSRDEGDIVRFTYSCKVNQKRR